MPSSGPRERREITYLLRRLSMANMVGSGRRREASHGSSSPEGCSPLQFWDPAWLVGWPTRQVALLGMGNPRVGETPRQNAADAGDGGSIS